MYVGTIHAYCLNLLQQPPIYHFLKYYSADGGSAEATCIDRNSKKSGLTEVPLLDGRTLTRWVDSRLYQALLSVLDEGGVKGRLIPAAVLGAAAKYRGTPAREEVSRLIREC